MQFYRENKVNPAASCLPLAPPDPDLHLALLRAQGLREGRLSEVPELGPRLPEHRPEHHRQHQRALDRSELLRPPLLVLYVSSQLASTLFMSATMDNAPASTSSWRFRSSSSSSSSTSRSGLMLYWTTTNLWTVGQGLSPAAWCHGPSRRPSAAREPNRNRRRATAAATEPSPEAHLEARSARRRRSRPAGSECAAGRSAAPPEDDRGGRGRASGRGDR